MTIEEPEPNSASDHILDWLEDSASFLPSFLDDPCSSGEINCYHWWAESQDLITEDLISTRATSSLTGTPPAIATGTETSPGPAPENPTTPNPNPNLAPSPSSSKKRKASDYPTPKTSQNQKIRNQGRRINLAEEDDGDCAVGEVVPPPKKLGGNKKGSGKAAGNNNSNSGNMKEGRWAEQLLNPCATAITAGNLTRVQHLLYVLHELASPTGDANHRLAAHGLRALTLHLSSASASPEGRHHMGFSAAEPRFFQKSLLKFYEVSPWFSFPNTIANSSILQILSREPDPKRNLHILDVGVSHGVQWPTLLEALTRRPGGPPPLVRITVINSGDQKTGPPFSIGPPENNLSPRLLGFAKSMNVNLQISWVDNRPLQMLNSRSIDSSADETLIVCAQFRAHQLSHTAPDERTEFLRAVREMGPKGVILSENDAECSCSGCGDFSTGFGRRVEYLWKFLDSTSSAFKGRESDERRLMEGEAAKAITSRSEMNEGKDRWCERMRGVGFVEEAFGEDAIDTSRALLRKYDNNWEMRVDDRDGFVGLWWKRQPVSFCSLWKLGFNVDDSLKQL